MVEAITLPQLGESVTEGVITAWLVEPNETVRVGQPIAEISTDKVDTEIPSPVAGVVQELRVAVDDTVEVGRVIATIASDRSVAEARHPRLSPKVRRLLRERELAAASVTGTGTDGRITPADVQAVGNGAGGRTDGSPTPRTTPGSAARARHVAASPLVRTLLRGAGLSAADVVGTGPSGRVTRDDARRAIAATEPDVETLTPQPAVHGQVLDPGSAAPSGRRDEVKLSRTRRTIADRMLHSLQTTAQLTAVVEVDMTRLMLARDRAKDTFERREGIPLSPFPLMAWAVCSVLARHPVLNAEIDLEAGTATYHRDVNLGVAVDTDHGLMVPTVRSAQDLSISGLTRRIADLAARARQRDLRPDDVTDGTFTLTNTGSRGVMLDTPILAPPQVAILATTLIEKRPVVVVDEFGADSLAIRQMSYLCLTYDHRLVDGADAARFLTDLEHTLETRDLLPELDA